MFGKKKQDSDPQMSVVSSGRPFVLLSVCQIVRRNLNLVLGRRLTEQKKAGVVQRAAKEEERKVFFFESVIVMGG